MSGFKDAVAKDVKGTFINGDEFAGTHIVNGEEVVCIVDKDLTQELQTTAEGVFLNAVTIYIDEADIATRPVEGELLHVDSEFYTVRSVSDEEGVLVIVAELNAQ